MTHLMQTYGRFPVAFVKGEGIHLYDADGRAYLDFTSGIAVTSLGHAHPNVTRAIAEQAATLLHTSNLYEIPLQEQVAGKLTALSGLDRAFFCNSGAEANEAAIKLARKYSTETYGSHKYEILTLHESFHGRTMATLTATPRPKFQEGYAPLMPGFRYVEKDLDAIKAALSDQTCAILVETVQGEGGVLPLGREFLQGLRALCDEKGILLLIDEVQTGIGRTGTLFAFEQAGILPDIVSLAKALGNGVPVGAILAKEHVAAAFTPGTHGSTFGGNPLAMAAANAVLDTIAEEGLLEHVQQMAAYLESRLDELVAAHDFILSQRGHGLIRGLLFDRPAGPLVSKCLEYGLLVLTAGEKTLRFLPPLTVTEADIDLMMQLLQEALAD
ncbi:aspartate aminotransferase family protein [Tumebacillus sp. DT12]|uniref:Acetylornithine aminotransferase n=1 Tax=Tumebacillus lacus TaxID=2995335 RepID=A0ABT3X548_9BACL|nr:aspartate aminotransferase family protein [Tumebacillus lacus]MCX7572026.1 aspartate aminotransferase family protein [Tumebacillus lacus]